METIGRRRAAQNRRERVVLDHFGASAPYQRAVYLVEAAIFAAIGYIAPMSAFGRIVAPGGEPWRWLVLGALAMLVRGGYVEIRRRFAIKPGSFNDVVLQASGFVAAICWTPPFPFDVRQWSFWLIVAFAVAPALTAYFIASFRVRTGPAIS